MVRGFRETENTVFSGVKARLQAICRISGVVVATQCRSTAKAFRPEKENAENWLRRCRLDKVPWVASTRGGIKVTTWELVCA